MTRIVLFALVVIATLACSASVEEGSASIINTTCPIMGEEVDAEVATYDWNGKQVGFCCKGCIEDFAGMSEEEKVAALK